MTDQKKRDYRSRAERMKVKSQDAESEQLEALDEDKSQDQIDYERHQEYLEEEKSRLTSEPRVYQEKQGPKRKYLYILAAVLILVMVFMIFRTVFIPGDQITEDTSEKISLALKETSEKETSESESSQESSEDETSEESSADVETIESIESSQPLAESVTVTDLESEVEEEVITGDWDPVPTEQTGEHVTDYSSGSQDRIEIKQAAAIAMGIDPANISEHWVGNDGSNQGVYATVSDGYQGEQYRVHIQWVDGQGWQATEVEAAP